MTVDMWVRTTATGVQHILGKRDGCGAIQYQLAQDPGSGLHFTGNGTVATGVQLAVNTWTHLAVTADGATLRFFINGALVNSAAGTCVPTFAGQFDEVEFFDRALSAGEIAAIYNAGTAGKCKPQCRGRVVTTTGTVNGSQIDLTEGNDVWVGNAAAETVYGYGGYDRMCGRGGADELHGGDDKDQLQGDRGRDRLFGENDNDHLYGNAGNDYLDGGAGNDNCSGGPGTNTRVDCEN